MQAFKLNRRVWLHARALSPLLAGLWGAFCVLLALAALGCLWIMAMLFLVVLGRCAEMVLHLMGVM